MDVAPVMADEEPAPVTVYEETASPATAPVVAPRRSYWRLVVVGAATLALIVGVAGLLAQRGEPSVPVKYPSRGDVSKRVDPASAKPFKAKTLPRSPTPAPPPHLAALSGGPVALVASEWRVVADNPREGLRPVPEQANALSVWNGELAVTNPRKGRCWAGYVVPVREGDFEIEVELFNAIAVSLTDRENPKNAWVLLLANPRGRGLSQPMGEKRWQRVVLRRKDGVVTATVNGRARSPLNTAGPASVPRYFAFGVAPGGKAKLRNLTIRIAAGAPAP